MMSDAELDRGVRRLKLTLAGTALFTLGIVAGKYLQIWMTDRAPCTYGTVKTMVTEQDSSVHIVCAAPPPRPECRDDVVHAAWDFKVIPYDREVRDKAVAELGECTKESKSLMWALHACEVGRTLDMSQCTLAKAPSSSATAAIENKK